jgi:hypothetical protein
MTFNYALIFKQSIFIDNIVSPSQWTLVREMIFGGTYVALSPFSVSGINNVNVIVIVTL